MPVVNYVWDPTEDNIMAEYDDQGDLIARYTTEPELYGNVISQYRDGQTSYFHHNGIGNTTAVTNDNGDVTDTRAYTAFGEITESSGTTEFPFQFIGQKGYYRDEETGDYSVRARPFEPVIARWMSTDPLGFFDGSNLFLYVRNEPTLYTDESGLWCGVLEPCCCCALDVSLKKDSVVEKKIEPEFNLPGVGATFTVNFKTDWIRKLIDANAAKEKNDCELVWNERSTRGLTLSTAQKKALIDEVKKTFGKDVVIENQKPKTWHNQHKEFWFFKFFKPWRDRKKPCPGQEVTPITDTPGVWGVSPKKSYSNVIQFELMLKSAPNCECPKQEEVLHLEFFARMKKGAGVWRLFPLDDKPDKIPEKDYTKL